MTVRLARAGFVAGVDGGKSKTVCLIARRDGTIVGRARGGGSDWSIMPLPEAVGTIVGVVHGAADDAGVARDALEVACLGLAGAVWPEDVALAEAHLGSLGQRVAVRNDAQVALVAASGGGPGVLLSAGTHLAAAILTPDGRDWFSGWSSVDGPGGAEVGRRTLWAAIHAWDGRGPETALTDAVTAGTGLTAEGLLRAIARCEVDEVYTARLAPLLFQVHERTNDPVARSLIIGIADEMARWVIGLCRRFDLLDQPVDAYLTGGLFRAPGTLLIRSLERAVHADAPFVRLARSGREPVVGALIEALRLAGRDPTDSQLKHLVSSAPPSSFYDTEVTAPGPPSASAR